MNDRVDSIEVRKSLEAISRRMAVNASLVRAFAKAAGYENTSVMLSGSPWDNVYKGQNHSRAVFTRIKTLDNGELTEKALVIPSSHAIGTGFEKKFNEMFPQVKAERSKESFPCADICITGEIDSPEFTKALIQAINKEMGIDTPPSTTQERVKASRRSRSLNRDID